MRFKDDSNKHNSLYHDTLFWIFGSRTVSTSQYDISDFTASANLALDRVSSLIMRFDTTWEWDDDNQSDLPIATTDLKAQADYSLAITHLKILRVRVKDKNGNWITLDPVSRRSLTDTDLASTGVPQKYDKVGTSFILTPKPDYASTGGIEVQFQRPASNFTTADTTKEPGFASQSHRLISLYAALDHCEANGIDKRAAVVRKRIGRPPNPKENDPGEGMEMELAEFYSDRDRDDKPSMALEPTIETF